MDHASDEVARDRHDALARAEVLLEPNLGDRRVAVLEGQDVAHVAAAPLVDRLVVVTDDADAGAEFVNRLDDGLLDRVDVLVLVDDDVANPVDQALAQVGIALQLGHSLLQDSGVVQVAAVVQQLLVRGEVANDRIAVEQVGCHRLVLSQDAQRGDEVPGVDVALEGLAAERRALGQARALRVPVDEEGLLNLVEHLVLHERRHLGLQHLEAEAMDRADVHLGQPCYLAHLLATAGVDPLLELGRGLVGEGERDDVLRCAAPSAGVGRSQESDHSLCNDLSLAGAGAGDELEVAVDVVDGGLLGGGVAGAVHRSAHHRQPQEKRKAPSAVDRSCGHGLGGLAMCRQWARVAGRMHAVDLPFFFFGEPAATAGATCAYLRVFRVCTLAANRVRPSD